MRCEQELCEYWTGSGCICEVLGVENLRPMTADQVAWVRASRPAEPEPEPDECKALPPGSGRCAYAGSDGKSACGAKCIYVPTTPPTYGNSGTDEGGGT